MKIMANLLDREVRTVSCTLIHIIVDCGNFKIYVLPMCFRWPVV